MRYRYTPQAFIRVALFFTLCFFTAAQSRLPPVVQATLSRSALPADAASIWIAPVDGGAPIVEWNSRVPRSPASVTKTITTGVGLLLLGENYRWKTEFYTDGKIADGVLNGNLVIKGYGNPYMVEERLVEMIDALQNLGISHIDGNVVLDNSYFISEVETPDAFDGNGMEPYNALPSALAINFRTIDLIFNVHKGKITVSSDPELTYTTIQNQVKTSRSKRCRGNGFAPHISINRNREIITVSGTVSTACRHKRLTKVLTDAGDLFFGNFKKFWQAAGGQISGQWLYGQADDSLTLLYRSQSRPLYEQIAAMNKHSNNLMTRQLFLTLGAEQTQPPATLVKSRAVVMNALEKMGIPTHSLFIDNGSGLSRQTRLTAEQLGQFLIAMQHSQARLPFENSLSIAGVDGTLRHRLRNTPLENNAIGKTGTLKNAKSIAGYLTAQSGKKYAYVILLEGNKARNGRPLMDEIMQWVYTL